MQQDHELYRDIYSPLLSHLDHLYPELIWDLQQTLARGTTTSSITKDPSSLVSYTSAYAVNLNFSRRYAFLLSKIRNGDVQ